MSGYCAAGSRLRRPAMSLKPDLIQPVPEATASVARAVFRKGNPLVSLRDEFGTIFADADFADLFPKLGQPGGCDPPSLGRQGPNAKRARGRRGLRRRRAA